MKAEKTPASLRVGRDAPGFLLRMPKSMRTEAKRESELTERSMNTVLLRHIQRSMGLDKSPGTHHKAEESSPPDYYMLNENERTLFVMLKKLSSEKQLALLTLLK